jgi:acetyl-CoA carboxylase biotin carboxylase subunit
VRVDSAVHEGAMVQPYYDSLVSKLIVYAPDRESAIRKLLGAMNEYVVEGIRTSLPLQKLLLSDPAFHEVRFHTRYIDEWLKTRGG